jgi:hypothetical protein
MGADPIIAPYFYASLHSQIKGKSVDAKIY